jgi:hypothetical protein
MDARDSGVGGRIVGSRRMNRQSTKATPIREEQGVPTRYSLSAVAFGGRYQGFCPIEPSFRCRP